MTGNCGSVKYEYMSGLSNISVWLDMLASSPFVPHFRVSGIPCRVVTGKMKASALDPGDPIPASSRYNAVLVDGDWRFVHPAWGSYGIVGGEDSHRQQWEGMDTESGQQNGDDNEPMEIVQIRDDFWFLTDPEVMAFFHLSEDPSLQLLPRPISMEEFQDMASLEQGFFEMKLATVSHPRCYFEVDGGRDTLTFQIPEKSSLEFSYNMYKSLTNKKNLSSSDAPPPSRLVLMERYDGCLHIQIQLAAIGKYKLELRGRDSQSGSEPATLCEYVIRCTEPCFDWRELPPGIPTDREWGLTVAAHSQGYTHGTQGGYILARDGKAEVLLTRLSDSTDREPVQSDSEPVQSDSADNEKPQAGRNDDGELKPKLTDEDQKDRTRGRVYLYRRDRDLVFCLRLDQRGYYTFLVNDQAGHTLGRYLVYAEMGCVDSVRYDVAGGVLGEQAADRDRPIRLRPVSHTEPVVEVPTTGELELIMATDGPPQTLLSAKLYRHGKDKKASEPCEGCLLYTADSGRHTFQLRFCQHGIYSLKLWIFNPESEDSEGRSSDPDYIYLFLVSHPASEARTFPIQAGTDVRGCSVHLLQPLVRQLTVGQDVCFRLLAPGAQSVFVEAAQSGHCLDLQPEGEDREGEGEEGEGDQGGDEGTGVQTDQANTWQGVMTTGQEPETLQVCAEWTAGEPPIVLYTYQVREQNFYQYYISQFLYVT